MISKKVILTGSFGVGKSSLFKRFIEDKFDDKYLTTVGVKVNNKTLTIDGEQINFLVWDIAGEVRQDKVPPAYFLGAAGVIFVFDLTRPYTSEFIDQDIEFLKNLLPYAVVKIVGNKKDLLTEEELESRLKLLPRPCDAITSAKTGEQVEELFRSIAKQML